MKDIDKDSFEIIIHTDDEVVVSRQVGMRWMKITVFNIIVMPTSRLWNIYFWNETTNLFIIGIHIYNNMMWEMKFIAYILQSKWTCRNGTSLDYKRRAREFLFTQTFEKACSQQNVLYFSNLVHDMNKKDVTYVVWLKMKF
jgi:hypothetical protein